MFRKPSRRETQHFHRIRRPSFPNQKPAVVVTGLRAPFFVPRNSRTELTLGINGLP